MCKDKRELILVRHAQAESISYSGLDFDRALTGLGEEQAILMARRTLSFDLKIDQLICSPAIRTKMTALAFCREMNYQPREILYLDRLYEGTLQDYLKLFSTLAKNTIIFGHNPGIEDFGNWLCGGYFQNFPPAGVMCAKTTLDQIANMARGGGELIRFEYPEMF